MIRRTTIRFAVAAVLSMAGLLVPAVVDTQNAFACSLSSHCYAIVGSTVVSPPSGFAGTSVDIGPNCMTTNGDSSNFNNDEEWAIFNTSNFSDWIEAGAKVGLTYYGGSYSYPEYFWADDRSDFGYGYYEHNSGNGVVMNQYFEDTLWYLGSNKWEAWTPGISGISSPQDAYAYDLEAGTEDTANDVATHGYLANIQYEAITGGWRSGWTSKETTYVTPNSPGYAAITTWPTNAVFSFNSC